MRILHSSDLHLGESKSIFGDSYLKRQNKALYQILDIAINKKVDAIIIAGDAFHAKRPTQEEKDALLRFIIKAYKSKIRVVLSAGDHDTIIHGYTSLHYLNIIQEERLLSNIHIVEKTELIEIKPKEYVLAIPFGWSIKKALRTYKNKIRHSISTIVVCHGTVIGAKGDNDYIIPEDEIKKDKKVHIFKNPKISYWALGDLHTQQRVANNAYYSGSPIQHRFGEPDNKGVLFINTKKNIIKHCPIESIQLEVIDSVDKAFNDQTKYKLVTNKIVNQDDVPSNVVSIEIRAKSDIVEIDIGNTIMDANKAILTAIKKGLKDIGHSKPIIKKVTSLTKTALEV